MRRIAEKSSRVKFFKVRILQIFANEDESSRCDVGHLPRETATEE
jgi:hypothetical protein